MIKFAYRFCVQCGGKLRRRREAGKAHLHCCRCGAIEYQNPKPTVGLFLVCRNELLLVKRARQPFQGWWDLPGGFVERGETLEEALEREVQEEVGMRLQGVTYFGSVPDVYVKGEPTLASYFMKRVTVKPVVQPADDVVEANWFSLSALPQRIAFKGQRRVVKRFVKKIYERG